MVMREDDAMAVASILHVDLDAFYASVEQLLDPSLRGKPIAVGGGVVLACSYEAKAFGVRSAMPLRMARELCPQLEVVNGHFSTYVELSKQVFDICFDVTPLVEKISIDEAFLQVGGVRRIHGAPAPIAATIRRRVREEVGLPISVGVARTKFLAKVASQVAKPDGLVVVDPQREQEFLYPLPVRLIWGVGAVTEARLAERGIHTVGELAEVDESIVRRLAGGLGDRIAALTRGIDDRSVETDRSAGSVGAQSAFGNQPVSPELVTRVTHHLADRIGFRMRAKQRAGHTVSVRVRVPGMKVISRAVTRPFPIATTELLWKEAQQLVWHALADHPDVDAISLIGISVSKLVRSPGLQLALGVDDEITPGGPEGRRWWEVDQSMDRIRERFGREAVGYAAVELREGRGVPDQFRELAERD